jgi:hypothetical protein
MKLYFLMSVAILMLILSCQSAHHVPVLSKINDSLQIVIIKSKDTKWLNEKSIPADLLPEEMNRMQTLLHKAMIAYNKTRKEDYYQVLPLKMYKLQCVVYLNEKKEKCVWVNGLYGHGKPRMPEAIKWNDWTKDIIMVRDGGNSYFNVTLNLARSSWDEVMINGYA